MFLSKIKSITLCAALVITAGSLLTGCAEQQKEGPEVIYYKMDIPELTVSNKRLGYEDIPELVLIDEEQFFWDYDPFEEEEYGRCETEGDILTAVSADGERQWKFRKNEQSGRLTLLADGSPEGAELIQNESVRELFGNGTTFIRDFAADTKMNADGSYEIITPYVFPVPGEGSERERRALLQIPEEELNRLTDRMLLETILDYPYGIAAANPEILAEEFNGMKEFLERPGAGEVLLEAFQEIGSDDTWEREYTLSNMLVYFANADLLSVGERTQFSEEVKDRASRGFTGCREFDNPGGREKTVFLRKWYEQAEGMTDTLSFDFEKETARLLRNGYSSLSSVGGEQKGSNFFEFRVEDDRVILYTEIDGTTYEYIFKIQNALLIFDRASSSVPEWESVKDGAVFE